MAKRLNTMTVVDKQWVTPHLVRLYLGGPGFAEFRPSDDTDMYIKIVFAPDGVSLPNPFDLSEIRQRWAPESQPVMRTYTVRSVGDDRIAVDFVVHGDEGIAGPWAHAVDIGETVHFVGPGSGYRPDPQAPWHLLAADEAGLPAVAAALESMPADATVRVVLEVGGPDDEIDLVAPTDADIVWVHRGASSADADDAVAGDNAPIIAAVREVSWLPGTPQVFIHGEAQAVMHNLRPYIRKERGVPANMASISGYWRRGRTEEGFREWKADLKAAESSGRPANE